MAKRSLLSRCPSYYSGHRFMYSIKEQLSKPSTSISRSACFKHLIILHEIFVQESILIVMTYNDKRPTGHVDLHKVPRHTLLSQNVDKNEVHNLKQIETRGHNKVINKEKRIEETNKHVRTNSKNTKHTNL